MRVIMPAGPGGIRTAFPEHADGGHHAVVLAALAQVESPAIAGAHLWRWHTDKSLELYRPAHSVGMFRSRRTFTAKQSVSRPVVVESRPCLIPLLFVNSLYTRVLPTHAIADRGLLDRRFRCHRSGLGRDPPASGSGRPITLGRVAGIPYLRRVSACPPHHLRCQDTGYLLASCDEATFSRLANGASGTAR